MNKTIKLKKEVYDKVKEHSNDFKVCYGKNVTMSDTIGEYQNIIDKQFDIINGDIKIMKKMEHLMNKRKSMLRYSIYSGIGLLLFISGMLWITAFDYFNNPFVLAGALLLIFMVELFSFTLIRKMVNR